MSRKEYHKLTAADSRRITCQSGFYERCVRPAVVCEHVHWNTGNTEGVSFFYYCIEHSPLCISADEWEMIK